jgi:hypothetical protein
MKRARPTLVRLKLSQEPEMWILAFELGTPEPTRLLEEALCT